MNSLFSIPAFLQLIPNYQFLIQVLFFHLLLHLQAPAISNQKVMKVTFSQRMLYIILSETSRLESITKILIIPDQMFFLIVFPFHIV